MKIVKCPECKSVQNTIYTQYEAYMNNFKKRCVVCGNISSVIDYVFITDEFKGNFLDERV